jgi:hypothetical protein
MCGEQLVARLLSHIPFLFLTFAFCLLTYPLRGHMQISPETTHVLAYLDQKSGAGLRKRNDVGVLLELAAESDAHEAINDLAFHGSFLFKLYQTLKKSSPGSEAFVMLEKEFTSAVEKVREGMAKLLVDADEEQVERFNGLYYVMSQGSLRNVIDLAHDLGVLKSVQNEQKYGTPDADQEAPDAEYRAPDAE